MADRSSLGPWVRRFLLEHLVDERNLSKNTQQSYRDALRLLLPFAASRVKKTVDCLQVDDLTADTIRAFLAHLEKNRRCMVSTRNQRLAAIHALVRFIGERSRNIFSGAARSGQYHSSDRASRRYRISKSLSWTLCSLPRTSVRNRGAGITLFCYSFITPAQEQARLRWSPLGTSKRSPTDRAWSNCLGREISEGLVLSGRVRCRNFFV